LLHRTYLVGEQITMADIAIVSALVYPFKLVTDKNYLKNYNNVTRWFTTCVNQPEFIAVIGTVVMCKKELLAEGQAAPVAEKAAAAPKKEKKEKSKDKDLAEEDDVPLVPVEKKAEHPYKIMDREMPSPFSMDTWKKTYSNASSYKDAMDEFWKMFDSNGWTLWYQTYNYNEDNKRIFMTANAIGGFQQRTDEIRKWAFGVQDVRSFFFWAFLFFYCCGCIMIPFSHHSCYTFYYNI
jgi:elongation factor 1-gamma